MARWIPCEQRQPETIGTYLVTIEGECNAFVALYGIGDAWFSVWGYPIEVTAWMRMPRPYEGKKHETD